MSIICATTGTSPQRLSMGECARLLIPTLKSSPMRIPTAPRAHRGKSRSCGRVPRTCEMAREEGQSTRLPNRRFATDELTGAGPTSASSAYVIRARPSGTSGYVIREGTCPDTPAVGRENTNGNGRPSRDPEYEGPVRSTARAEKDTSGGVLRKYRGGRGHKPPAKQPWSMRHDDTAR